MQSGNGSVAGVLGLIVRAAGATNVVFAAYQLYRAYGAFRPEYATLWNGSTGSPEGAAGSVLVFPFLVLVTLAAVVPMLALAAAWVAALALSLFDNGTSEKRPPPPHVVWFAGTAVLGLFASGLDFAFARGWHTFAAGNALAAIVALLARRLGRAPSPAPAAVVLAVAPQPDPSSPMPIAQPPDRS